MSNNVSMKKCVLWNSFGNLLYLACQWVVTVMVTRISGYQDAGILSVAMSVSATLQTIALFGVRNFQVSDIEFKYSDTTYFNFRTVTSIASVAVCVLFCIVADYSSEQFVAVLFYMLFRIAESVSDVMHGIAQKRGRLDVAGKSLAIKALLLTVSFFSAYLLSGSLNVGLGFMAISSALSTIFYDYVTVRKICEFGLYENIKKALPLLREVFPLCIYMFLFAALTSAPKLILEMLKGEEVLGVYSSIFAPATLIQAATAYIYNPFATAFAEHLQTKNYKGFSKLLTKISLIMLVISTVISLLAYLLGEFMLVIIFGESIRAHAYLLLPIIIVTVMLSYVGFFCMISTVLRDFKSIIIGCGVGFALSIALSFVFINRMNAQGTSIALIISAFIAVIILLSFILLKLRRLNRTNISKEAENVT